MYTWLSLSDVKAVYPTSYDENMNEEAIDTLVRSLKGLQVSSDYSDLKIFCGNEVFSVHKAIICPRSKFFTKACSWGKDGQPKGEIVLEDDDPEIVQLMVDYLYRLDYDELRSCSVVPSEACSQPVEENLGSRVPWDYGLSIKEKKTREKQMKRNGTWKDRLTQDQIDTEELLQSISSAAPAPEVYAEQEVTTDAGDPWAFSTFSAKKSQAKKKARLQDLALDSNADRIIVNAQVYALADKYAIEDLKRLAEAKFTESAEKSWRSEAFVQASQLVFETTPSTDLGLRSVVISILHEHRELMTYEEVQDLLDSGNGIAWQLVKALLA